MKKFVSVLLCLLCIIPATACKKQAPAPRIWLIEPSSESAETEIRQMVRHFDSNALISFVPAKELSVRISDAFEKDDAPDVFMFFADSIPDLAEKEKIADLSDRLRISKVKADELLESTRRACAYQGKTRGVPLFADVYLLATNRALVSAPPDTAEKLVAECEALKEKKLSSFEKLTPEKQTLLFETLLRSHGGKMLNARKTKLEFASEEGKTALEDCAELLKQSAEQSDAVGEGKAAFSILTMQERAQNAERYPDSEITLSSLFGLNRLQTVAMGMSKQSKNQKQAFALLEFLQTETDKLSALYKRYSAKKDISPISTDDADIIKYLSEATPAPDLCGMNSLAKTYIPAAIEKAEKGVNTTDALNEAEKDASGNIWQGKRE